MKYLFLDIDGVLNHEDWFKHKVGTRRYKEWWENCFDPDCVGRLNHILDVTGARLVVSSSWRIDKELPRYFESLGITTDFDVITSIYRETEPGSDDWEWGTRGEEINLFLKTHPCDGYVIIDDDWDFTEDQIKNHFVHCCADFCQAFTEGHEGETGLTERKMNEAINILRKN